MLQMLNSGYYGATTHVEQLRGVPVEVAHKERRMKGNMELVVTTDPSRFFFLKNYLFPIRVRGVKKFRAAGL